MSDSTQNRTALVTGACGGIGQAICDVFAAGGYEVFGIDIQQNDSFPHHLLQFDICRIGKDETAARELLDLFRDAGGSHLDVLVNNAAVQVVKPFTELTPEDWQATLDTNLLAPFWLTRFFYPLLKETTGSVVNIASIHANLTKKHFSAYATSKGALVTLTKALALELAPDVRINAILPAATNTPMLRKGFEGNEAGFTALSHYHPLDRLAHPAEVAELALYLAGPGARFMTGAAISVDGGISSVLHDPA